MKKQILNTGIAALILLVSLIAGVNQQKPNEPGHIPQPVAENTETSTEPNVPPQCSPTTSGDTARG